MDWGNDKIGKQLEMKLKRIFQDVLVRNEAAKPQGEDWIKIHP